MDKMKLDRVFNEVKAKANMDYAITNTDEYGNCNSCVNDELARVFGMESTGIYAKHWLKGMNEGVDWEYLIKVYIGHDITPEQGKILIEIFEENGYAVDPKEYDSSKAFCVQEEM